MAETLFTIKNLKLFNRLNKCIKQGITDLQSKDFEASENYIKFAVKTGKKLVDIAEDPCKDQFTAIVQGPDE